MTAERWQQKSWSTQFDRWVPQRAVNLSSYHSWRHQGAVFAKPKDHWVHYCNLVHEIRNYRIKKWETSFKSSYNKSYATIYNRKKQKNQLTRCSSTCGSIWTRSMDSNRCAFSKHTRSSKRFSCTRLTTAKWNCFGGFFSIRLMSSFGTSSSMSRNKCCASIGSSWLKSTRAFSRMT